MAYPTSLSNYTGNETLFAAGHAQDHNSLESKLGIGASTPVASTLLRGTGTGTSAWAQANLTTDVTGTLPVANGGTGVASSTGTVAVVLSNNPVLVTPTLGAASATSINKVTITTPASSATLTIANGKSAVFTTGLTVQTNDGTLSFASSGKTLTISNSLTLAGPDGDSVANLTGSQTLTNKRNTRRVVATTQSATPTINTDNTDISYITGLAQAITSMTTNLSGTPVNGDSLIISITDNGTARAITWGTSFEASGNVALPTTTVLSVRLDVGFLYNIATSKWRVVAVS